MQAILEQQFIQEKLKSPINAGKLPKSKMQEGQLSNSKRINKSGNIQLAISRVSFLDICSLFMILMQSRPTE